MQDFRLSVLKPRYEELFNSCLLRSRWLPRISEIAAQIANFREQYEIVETQTTVPWWLVGILHYRDLNFQEAHLHNGDPLTGRTVRPPQGYPVLPPANRRAYTFIESASDALRLRKFDVAKDRSIAAWLWRLEGWNGFGYANLGLNSEYLWNGTNHFGSGNNRGLMSADGSFNPNGTSQQVGAAALVWYFHHQGVLDVDVEQPQATPTPSLSSLNLSFSRSGEGFTSVRGNGSVDYTAQTATVSPVVEESQPTIQFLDVFKYYQKLPHQDEALGWLQQQLPVEVLSEFARRWRINSTALEMLKVPNNVGEQRLTTQQVLPTMPRSIARQLVPPAPPPRQIVAPVPPPPRVKPRTLAECIIAYCEEKGYKIDRGVGEKNIIYVEGMYPNGQLNDDAFNAWNDTRLVIEFKNGSPEIIGAWEATTEPGQYYTMQPMNLAGVARLAFGQYQSWQVGTHGQSDPHEALIQTGGSVTVYRDLNQDGARTGDRMDTGYFGINQHWGGDSPESDIGAWSAGCLVGRTRDGHREFMELCKQDPRYMSNRGFVFQATVIPGDDLFKRYPPSVTEQSRPGMATVANASASMNQAILNAALELRGMSSAEGPDGGNNACAWSINRVLKKAGINPLGENPNYVPSLVDALKGGRGQPVERAEAKPGDLVIAYEEAHVGVGLDEGCATVLSNSSSRASFAWESDTDYDGSYGGSSTIYRLIE